MALTLLVVDLEGHALSCPKLWAGPSRSGVNSAAPSSSAAESAESGFHPESSPPQKTSGINPAYRNLAVKPGDDFEEYANGGWRKSAQIPADRSSTGAAFEVFQRAEQRMAELIRGIAAEHPEPGTPREMIGNYYAAFIDTATIEQRGLEPLKDKLSEIDQIKSKTDLSRVLGERLRSDVDPLNATQLWTENLFG